MNIPPPQQNFAPTHTTTGGPTTLKLGPVSSPAQIPHSQNLENHPPGYRQDTSAQELSAAQRSSLEEQARKESVFGEGASETAGGMWNAMKGFANAAGERLSEAENAVWRGINGKGN
jgi:hypothetical protein